MANGTIAKPMGMLKDLKIKVPGHRVRHTFIVMDFSKHPMSYEMILGRPFMREAKMVHDWSKNHVYLQFQDFVIRMDLVTRKVHPLGGRAIIDDRSDTTVHSAPLKYCYTCRTESDNEQDSPYMDVLPGMTESDNVDWVHLAETIDTWGTRGTTWVTPEGEQIPQIVPVNMLRVAHVTSDDRREAHQSESETEDSSRDSDQDTSKTERN